MGASESKHKGKSTANKRKASFVKVSPAEMGAIQLPPNCDFSHRILTSRTQQVILGSTESDPFGNTIEFPRYSKSIHFCHNPLFINGLRSGSRGNEDGSKFCKLFEKGEKESMHYFQILGYLGKGSFGNVWKVCQFSHKAYKKKKNNLKKYELKCEIRAMKIQDIQHEKGENLEASRKAIENEISILKELRDLEGVVGIEMESRNPQRTVYTLVMEFVNFGEINKFFETLMKKPPKTCQLEMDEIVNLEAQIAV